MPYEVKGAFFVAARAWLDAHRPELVGAVLERIPREHRKALAEPLPSVLHPEESLVHALRALEAEVTRGDRERFVDLMDACTEIGLGRFFRVMLRLSTPGFVLKQVPTMWSQLRPSAGRVSVVPRDGGYEIRYSSFPFFDEDVYEQMTVGSLRALVRVCSGTQPRVEVLSRSRDSLTVRITP